MKSSFFYFFTGVFIGDGPGFDMLILLSESLIEMDFDIIDNFHGVIWLFDVEVLDILGHVIDFFGGFSSDLLIIVYFFEDGIDKYFDFLVTLLSLLFSEG